MGMTVDFDIGALVSRLQQIGDHASSNGARGLRRAAVRVQKLAVSYAPLEHGGLEDAIKIEEDSSGINRRKIFYVYVDPTSPELDASGQATGRLVGRYMHWIHEGDYKLGKASQAKNAGSGKVGPKFLERAADEVDGKAVTDMVLEQLRETFR